MTRAKKSLTFLFDPNDDAPLMGLNPILLSLSEGRKRKKYAKGSKIEVIEWAYA